MQNLPRIANWMSKAYGALSRNRFNQVAFIFQSPKTTNRCGNHAVGVTVVVREGEKRGRLLKSVSKR